MTTIDELLVRIEADTERLRRELARGDQRLVQFDRSVAQSTQKVEQRFERMSVGVSRSMKAFVAAFSVGAITRFVRSSIEAADAIGKTADKIGVTTTALQELRYAAESAGVQQNTLDMALQRFTRRSAEAARGTGEAKDALAELGIELRDQSGNLRPTEALLRDVADAFTRVEDPAERVRLAFKLFDSEGVVMVNMLRNGSAGMQEAAKRAHELGLVMDEEMIRSAEDANDALATLDMALSRTGQTAAVTFADDIRTAAEAVQDFLRWIKSPDFDDNPMVRFFRWIDNLDSMLGGSAAHRTLRRLLGFESAGDIQRELDLIDAQIAEAEEQLIEGRVSRSMEGTFRARMDEMLARRSELTRRLSEMESPGPRITITRGTPATPTPGAPAPAARSRRAATSDADREADAIKRVTAALAFEQEQLLRTAREQAQYSALARAGISVNHEAAPAIMEAAGAVYDLGEASRQLDEIISEDVAGLFGRELETIGEEARAVSDEFIRFGEITSSAFEDAILNGKELKDVLGGLLQDLARMGLRSASNTIFGAIGGFLGFGGGGASSALDSSIASNPDLFGFADGGNPPVGRPSIVGERGPELFVPKTAGTIFPNHMLGGSSVNMTYAPTIDARGADSAAIARLERILAEQERNFDQKAKAAAIDGRRRLGAFDQVYR